jgi:hypothetical protein
MKNVLVVLLMATLGVTVGAQQQPPWLSEMPPDGVLWGIGVAKQSNIAFSKTMAEARARQSIAFELNSCIQSAIVDYNRDAGSGGNIVSTTYQESITRIISSAQLIGSKVVNVFQSSDGTYYCRIQYSKEEAKRWMGDILKDKGEETFNDERVASDTSSLIDSNKEVKVTR